MRWGATTALGMALALILASNALAGGATDPRPGDKQLGKAGGIAYVSDTDRVQSLSVSANVYATCPHAGGKWRITGGGVRAAGLPSEVSIAVSRPADLANFFGDDDAIADDYWESVARAPVGTPVTSYAICAKLPKLTYKSVVAPDSPTPERTVTNSCNGSAKPTGGGGFIATTGSRITSMYPSSNGWTEGVFDANGGTGGMENDFICLKSKHLTTVVKKRKIPAGGAEVKTAKCPQGTHVTGGGAKINHGPAGSVLNSSYPYDGKDHDKIPDDGWTALAQNGSPGALKLSVYAICLD